MGGGNLVTLKYSIGLLALSLLQLPGTGAATTYTDQLYFIISTETFTKPHTPISLLVCI